MYSQQRYEMVGKCNRQRTEEMHRRVNFQLTTNWFSVSATCDARPNVYAVKYLWFAHDLIAEQWHQSNNFINLFTLYSAAIQETFFFA